MRENEKLIDVAELRHRITIQQKSKTSDGQGGFSYSWSTLATVWAKVSPVSTRERLYGQQIEYQRTHQIWLRYRSDITQEMQVTFDGRTFQIKGVFSPDERKIYTVLDAEENQGT